MDSVTPEDAIKIAAIQRKTDVCVLDAQQQMRTFVAGTLEDIVEKAQDIHPPAVLIVGEVVRLSEQLAWFAPQVLSIQNIQAELVSL